MEAIKIEQQELNPDLMPYLEKGRLFPMLRHPLVYSVPYYEGLNQMINRQYEMKLKMIADYVKKSDWSGYIYAHERPYRLQAFLQLSRKHEISDREYWELLGEIWTDSENIWAYKAQWKRLLSSDRGEKEFFMSEEDREALKSLPDKITVYRGYQPGKNKTGFSYSLSEEKARWFSKRFRTDGEVAKREIQKSKIFAYTNARSEQEVIII